MEIGRVVGIILLILHILVCVLVYLGIRMQLLKVKRYVFPVVVFVPVVGLICCLILSTQVFLKKNGNLDTETDRLKINEETYRSILTAPEEEQKEIIPLEEVLIVNDASVRRKLIMDILHDHPERYMDVLMQARLNEDVEVVHYATTAMAELSKSCDRRLQELEEAYQKNPDEKEMLDDYCAFFKQYLENGLVEGQLEISRREQYSALLGKKREMERKKGTQTEQELRELECTSEELIRNEFALSHYERAGELLDQMEPLFAQTEGCLTLRAEWYARLGRGEDLKKQIKKIEDSGIYLSHENRARMTFWKGADYENS